MGLDPGLWYYRVAAVMAGNDASNPGGEALASDPLAVVVPPLPGKVRVTVIWAAVPGAASYRVYRTPAAGELVGAVRLVGTVTGPTTRFTDTGVNVQAGAPLPEGALGQWHEVGPMPAAREGAGVTVAADPDHPGAWFLYAIGGRNAAGAALASYTFARIVVAAGGAQTVSDFAGDAPFLGTGRWQLGAIAMDRPRASVVPEGDTWIYALAGVNAAGTGFVREAQAGKVMGDGTLAPVYEVDAPPASAGYGLAGANNFLFVFGGTSGGTMTPGASATSAKMCRVGEAGCGGQPPIPEPPDLVNWNSLGFNLRQARHLPGSALESAFIFLVGGASGSAAATATTERTHW
jgi:hypothetical protein